MSPRHACLVVVACLSIAAPAAALAGDRPELYLRASVLALEPGATEPEHLPLHDRSEETEDEVQRLVSSGPVELEMVSDAGDLPEGLRLKLELLEVVSDCDDGNRRSRRTTRSLRGEELREALATPLLLEHADGDRVHLGIVVRLYVDDELVDLRAADYAFTRCTD